MAIGSGLGSQIGFAAESVYGTALAPTNWLEVRKAGLELQVDHMTSEALRSGLKVLRSDRQVVNKKGVNGDIELDGTSNNLAKLLRHCLNDDRAYTTTKTTSGSVYTYAYQIGDPAACPSLNFQIGVADVGGNVRRMDATGCFIKEFSIENKVDEILGLSLTVDGRDLAPSATAVTAVSYATGTEPLTFAGGAITLAGASVPVRSYSAKISHGIDLERYQINSSTLKSRPIRNSLTEISGTVELEFGADSATTWATDDLVTKFRAGTLISLTAAWTGVTAISGTTYPSFTVTTPACMITKATPTIEGPGLIMLSVDWQALDNGSNEPVTVTYVSSENVTS